MDRERHISCHFYTQAGNCRLRPVPNTTKSYLPCVGCDLQSGLPGEQQIETDSIEVTTESEEMGKNLPEGRWDIDLEDRGERVAASLGYRT